jgi:tight adherence protein C
VGLLPWIIVAFAVLAIIALLAADSSTARDSKVVEAVGRGNVRVLLPAAQVAAPKRRKKETRQTVRDRLVHAGLYKDNFVNVLQVLRFVLLGICCLAGYMLYEFGLMSLGRGLFIGIATGLAATILPVLLLDQLKSRRQIKMRRALPDALDVIVVCLDGGLSLPASFSRVAQELADTHPLLAKELRIAEREIQMGHSIGEAIRNLAGRFDLEELRSLASVLSQADRFGASVSKGFKVFAASMRQRRQQEAEERAHKAAVKLILPTALLIFPAMFVVTLAPAVFRAIDVLAPILLKVDTQVGKPL